MLKENGLVNGIMKMTKIQLNIVENGFYKKINMTMKELMEKNMHMIRFLDMIIIKSRSNMIKIHK
jgi:hypothetical protein